VKDSHNEHNDRSTHGRIKEKRIEYSKTVGDTTEIYRETYIYADDAIEVDQTTDKDESPVYARNADGFIKISMTSLERQRRQFQKDLLSAEKQANTHKIAVQKLKSKVKKLVKQNKKQKPKPRRLVDSGHIEQDVKLPSNVVRFMGRRREGREA